MTNVYLNIEPKAFKKFQPAAIKFAKENCGDDWDGEETYEGIDYQNAELEFDNGQLNVSGDLSQDSIHLGYLGVSFKLDLDVATDIVNYYMKKLGKLKTVLESTK